jgi:hypothetical protein
MHRARLRFASCAMTAVSLHSLKLSDAVRIDIHVLPSIYSEHYLYIVM